MNRGENASGATDSRLPPLGLAAALAVVAFVGVVVAAALLLIPPEATIAVDAPGAIAPLPDGGFLYAERQTGDIFRVDGDLNAQLASTRIAHVDVRADGHRGLVGLAASSSGDVFAAWTAPDGHLVVGRIAPGPATVIWRGPETAQEANGGRIALTRDENRIVVGVGNLLDPDAVTDAETPNGKLLALDPAGAADQTPEILSLGWNNPFAFAVGANGEIWVADNAPRSEPERFARGDSGSAPAAVTELGPNTIAPAGLALDANGDLLVCGFVSGELRRHRVGASGRADADGDLVTRPCAIDVAVLTDGRVATAYAGGIRVLDL